MKLRRGFLFALLLWASPFLSGQDSASNPILAQGPSAHLYTVLQSVSIPSVATVGDPVELRLVLAIKKGVQVVPSREMVSSPWVKIQNVEILRTPPDVQIVIHYTSFAPGNKKLPPIPLGDIVLTDLRIQTQSVLDPQNTTTLAGPRPQLVLPQTQFYLGLALFGLVALPFLLWWLRGLVKAIFRRSKKARARRKPYRQLQKSARLLTVQVATLNGRDFYSRFSAILRAYLTGRLGAGFDAATPSEIEKLLAGFHARQRQDWVQLVRSADEVRFAGQNPDVECRLRDLSQLKLQASKLESGEATHVDL